MDRKLFWFEALKGGTMIGLVRSAFALLQQALIDGEKTKLASIVGIISFVALVLLVYAFCRKVASYANPAQGFSYGKGMSFVFAMMLFTGVITGLYSAIVNNFFMTDQIYDQINEMMVVYESMLPAEQVDTFYDSMVASMMNPITLILSNTFANLLVGGFVGIFVCSLTIRRPDIFADATVVEEKQEAQNESNE
ncbi:MAG: DUF4199 domain-containing protein [Tidjanibacter sp.]|nr:DUF4199 domain-containing protein [Tidjanibacter sp.]MBR6813107.1 DUF4199 domain-containing protein [Tidjanibacter sp.]MBR7103233.1 DUF4199 domain-containing protein [Tidjanibacter sp.]